MPITRDITYPSITELRYKDLRFLITDSPDDENVQSFTDACLKYGVTALVRVSEKTYDTKPIEAAGIKVYNLEYPDGSAPDSMVRNQWLTIVKENKNGCIAVHCLHGLGRSPVLVAMALREAGMNRQESIDFVRTRRRGSFNVRQLEFLQNYHSAHRLADKHVGCVIM
jgi:protein tyrosine phosphatase type 4A